MRRTRRPGDQRRARPAQPAPVPGLGRRRRLQPHRRARLEPAAHLRHGDGGLGLQGDRAVPAGVGAGPAGRQVRRRRCSATRSTRPTRTSTSASPARRPGSASATTTSTSWSRTTTPLGTTDPLAPSRVPVARTRNCPSPTPAACPTSSRCTSRAPRRYGGSVIVADGTSLHGNASSGSDYVTFAPFRLHFAGRAPTARASESRSAATPRRSLTRRSTSARWPRSASQLVDNDLDLVLRNDD